MTTANKRSRQQRALAVTTQRLRNWENARETGAFPEGYDPEADIDAKVAQAVAEIESLTGRK